MSLFTVHRSLRITSLLAVATLFALVSCTDRHAPSDALQRSKVDALNKAAFQWRYQDSERSEAFSRKALAYVKDSLPGYADGRLRAWNNISVSFFNRAMHDSVICYVDSVLNFDPDGFAASNIEVEQTLAMLLKARLLQRKCDIAGSYQILYDIEHSGMLEGHDGEFLYNLVKSQFYITTTTLNYHYRSKSQYEQAELMTKMEEQRKSLSCDYVEDMSFNYALAYGYYSLCSDSLNQSRYLNKALMYCEDNLRLLGDSVHFCTYQLGNTYQLIGFMLWS